jgi:hypothetical protein
MVISSRGGYLGIGGGKPRRGERRGGGFGSLEVSVIG